MYQTLPLTHSLVPQSLTRPLTKPAPVPPPPPPPGVEVGVEVDVGTGGGVAVAVPVGVAVGVGESRSGRGVSSSPPLRCSVVPELFAIELRSVPAPGARWPAVTTKAAVMTQPNAVTTTTTVAHVRLLRRRRRFCRAPAIPARRRGG